MGGALGLLIGAAYPFAACLGFGVQRRVDVILHRQQMGRLQTVNVVIPAVSLHNADNCIRSFGRSGEIQDIWRRSS